jgi:hypothetical protein
MTAKTVVWNQCFEILVYTAVVIKHDLSMMLVHLPRSLIHTMKLTSHTNHWIARLMLGLVLFAQGVVAANACDVLGGGAAQAFSAKEADASGMHCHDEDTPNTNACLAHCTQGNQVNVDQVIPAFVTPSVVTLVVDVPVHVSIVPSYFTSHIALDTGPPVSIRFCSFQI